MELRQRDDLVFCDTCEGTGLICELDGEIVAYDVSYPNDGIVEKCPVCDGRGRTIPVKNELSNLMCVIYNTKELYVDLKTGEPVYDFDDSSKYYTLYSYCKEKGYYDTLLKVQKLLKKGDFTTYRKSSIKDEKSYLYRFGEGYVPEIIWVYFDLMNRMNADKNVATLLDGSWDVRWIDFEKLGVSLIKEVYSQLKN